MLVVFNKNTATVGIERSVRTASKITIASLRFIFLLFGSSFFFGFAWPFFYFVFFVF